MNTTAASAARTSNRPLGADRSQWRRFFFHHVPLGVASATVFVLWMLPHGMRLKFVIAATGDIALALVTFTLMVGPVNLLLRRRNPISNYLRRDAGYGRQWSA